MKVTFVKIGIIGLAVGLLTSCKDFKRKDLEESRTKIEVTEEGVEISEETISFEELIVNNVDKYPTEIDLLGDNSVGNRIREITGADFEEILTNFETVTPIVNEGEVYKFTGCKQHECPGFLIKIYYDANSDNFNVLVSRNGRIKVYEENGKITVPKTLEYK